MMFYVCWCPVNGWMNGWVGGWTGGCYRDLFSVILILEPILNVPIGEKDVPLMDNPFRDLTVGDIWIGRVH